MALRANSRRLRPLARLLLVLVLSTSAAAVQQQKDTAITSAWVKLPAAGATAAEAYLVVNNPTMYDVFLQKASSDAAGAVEFRAAGKPDPLTFVTVAAYESLEMNAKGTYLVLRDLKKPLTEGATVPISVTTGPGAPLTVQAVVKKE
jgi:copper(I)-binding protein